MPSFKPKANKKFDKIATKITTVDNKHKEKMDEFNTIKKKEIPELKKKKNKIIKSLKKNLRIEDKLLLEDELKNITKKIKTLEKKEKNYLLDNIEYVFDYFEKKQHLTTDNNKTKVLHSFFNKNNYHNNKKDDTNVNYIKQYLINNDETMIDLEDYKKNVESCNSIDSKTNKVCNGELIAVEQEGVKICNKCGKRNQFLLTNDKPSYKEPPKEVCFYAYKRINHFREILAQFQAKETTQIPENVLKDIKLQIKKERITIKDITNVKAKDILKKLGYNKYYEHIPFIKEKLGIKPPTMTQELEDKLCSLFMDIQRPYAKHCPESRVNFLNYYYVLYKMCELLEKHEFLPYFPMLKDKVKRIEQDEIWKKICNELGWQFIPTI